MSYKPEAVRPISKPRVVDASRPRLRIEVEASEAAELLTRWNDEVFEPTLGEIRPLLERSAEETRALAASLPASDFIVRVTGGIQYTAPPEIHAVVFFPSWWFRPWVLMSEHKNLRIFNYGVGAATTSDDVDFGDLARLYK